jgi:uncharacterized protein (TIGR02680 family)
MTTIEDLTSWRVAAIRGDLPDPARADRWQPLRAGLVNMWEYDNAEVWYADGRMQLQGANESGKSTLMTLTTLLLLAGDISAHNIDTLGQGNKRFRYYVEPTDHDLDRRDATALKNRGWAWLEFGKGSEFFTIMLFAEARRVDGALRTEWCSLRGDTRIRSGMSLAKAGLIADPGQFRDVPGFIVYQSAIAYRDALARMLYGTDEAWLGQLIRILRVIRTPQIGHKIDLKFLTESFRIALPPVAEDEVNQLADGWEQLQRLRDERDEAEQALGAVTQFTRSQWQPWANAVIRAAADPVAAATSALTQITREERTAKDAVDHLTADQAKLDGQRTAEQDARLAAETKRDTLKEQQSYQDAIAMIASAQQLAEQATQAEATARRSRERAKTAQGAIAPAIRKREEAKAKLDRAERDVATVAGNLTAESATAGLAEITAQFLPTQDTPRLRQAASQRMPVAREALQRIGAHEKALEAAEAAAVKATEARDLRDEALRIAAEREAAVEEATAGVAEALSAWAQGIDVRVRPTADLVERWLGLVTELTDSASPAPVVERAISRDHLLPTRDPLARIQLTLGNDLEANEKSQRDVQAEIDDVAAERDPRPRAPEFWSRRERPDGVTSLGAPLWRLVETLGDAPAGPLEAALDAAGLLQAWVTPDGAYLTSRDGSESVWTLASTGSPGHSSLTAVLRPADDCGGLGAVVARLLGSIGYGDELPAGGPAITSDGRWRHGGLSGMAVPAAGGPRLLGATARAADRQRRIARLRGELADLTARHERLSVEKAEVDERIAALDDAAERLPSDTGVITAILTARSAAGHSRELANKAGQAEQAERDAQRSAGDAAARVTGHCAEHELPVTRPEVDLVVAALREYLTLVGTFEGKLTLAGTFRQVAKDAADAVDDAEINANTAAEDAETDAVNATRLRTSADAANKALDQDAQQILQQVRDLDQRVRDADSTLGQLTTERETLIRKLARAEATLGETEGRRQRAEADREAAVARWWGCVDTGLPRLREIPEPAARTVTAALEMARGARSTIIPRNWPDDPQLSGQQVQRRWADMTAASANLRSVLERLGGRTMRVSPPGDGQDDFPGAVELIVDGTGMALAPPDGSRRLSQLLERLQQDYDEELTKTIDELLGSTFIEHLRDRLGEAERLRVDINEKLKQNPTAISGITLRLQRAPIAEERAANDVLQALERDFELLPKPTQDRIRQFLADRITSAQEQARTSGDPAWRSRLAQILDYRRWFDLRVEYRTPLSKEGDQAGGWRKLDRGDHGLLSGGAKVVTLMQPFIAALHAMYDQSGTGPRMLWLDEAFGGVDATNKASMFRLLASCDLDWLIAGPGIIANSAAVPVAAIYEVRRAPQSLPGVSLELALWAGNELTYVSTPDPADLRDLAADGDHQDDTLFADV